jgi:hypothetical protein
LQDSICVCGGGEARRLVRLVHGGQLRAQVGCLSGGVGGALALNVELGVGSPLTRRRVRVAQGDNLRSQLLVLGGL